MIKRVRYMWMLCIGSLIVPVAQANNAGAMGAIDQDLMNMVAQVMYGKTTGQVIDELVYTYGKGEQNVTSLASIVQLLSQQLGYLNIAVTSAQAIVAILPPTSPHLIAAKLMINELGVFITCVQTVLAQVQQNAQPVAPAPAASPAVTAPAPTATTSATPAPGSDAALASAAVSLFGDIASAIAASSSNAPTASQTTSSSTVPATGSGTHHHGHGW